MKIEYNVTYRCTNTKCQRESWLHVYTPCEDGKSLNKIFDNVIYKRKCIECGSDYVVESVRIKSDQLIRDYFLARTREKVLWELDIMCMHCYTKWTIHEELLSYIFPSREVIDDESCIKNCSRSIQEGQRLIISSSKRA